MEYSSIFVCLMGMGTVFFGLICLIALTYLMSAVVGRGKKAAPAPVPAAPQTAGKGLLRGEYGALPGQVNPEVRALAGIDPEEVITCRPADNIAPELETYKEQFKDIAKSEEDVLSLALFPQVAPKFIEKRDHQPEPVTADAPAVRELYVDAKSIL